MDETGNIKENENKNKLKIKLVANNITSFNNKDQQIIEELINEIKCNRHLYSQETRKNGKVQADYNQ